MSTWWGTIDRLPTSRQDAVLRTIAALYDDTIDTEHTLNDLRKSDLAPEQFSVILREHVLEGNRVVSSETQLSRVVAATALDSVSTWLRGLATLIMSDRATYLVAGPVGYVLATEGSSRATRDRIESESAVEAGLVNQQLLRALRRFGFGADESGYMEARIAAGSPFIAITSADVDALRTAHGIFSKRAAVYLGLARTDPHVEPIIQHLAEMGPLPRTGSVLVADATSNLVRSSDLAAVPAELEILRTLPVLTLDGIPYGTVRDGLYRGPRNGDPAHLRYLVVARRRFHGLRTWLEAIPVAAVTIGESDIRLALDAERLRHIPHFSPLRPMSRLEERELDAAFGVAARSGRHNRRAILEKSVDHDEAEHHPR